MCRLTHVLWSILDKELDSHGYFTIWLNLNEKKAKIDSRSGQKCQKSSNFQNLFSWKQRHVSEAESPQQSNGTISFPEVGYNSKKLHLNVWRHHWALWGRQKHPFWGLKIIVSSWNFAHWLKTASSTIYIPVFENFENFGFFDHFSKKSYFLKILGSKKQNFKNPR